MFHSIEKQVADAFHAHIQIRYGIDLAVTVEQPRQSGFGDMAIPAAFQLAKQLKNAPRKIAAELVDEIGPIDGVAAMEVAGNGYINIRLDRGAYGAALLSGQGGAIEALDGKIIVEHTNINPNKAAHIGHLRNATLGDTFVRMLRARGHQVEVQNYIDNTGVQVADVVVGFHHLEHKSPADVQALIDDPAVRFDYYCWDLYARTSSYYKDHPESLAWRTETLHAIESGEGEVAELAHLVADAIVQAHLATMLRLGVEYDVLPRESEILHLRFWAAAFELLKEKKAIYFETEGKLAGCWVMPGLSEEGKVIVRSDGTVVYTGKDIAYQLWKFGLLGRDFHYLPLHTYADGRVLWVSTDEPVAQVDRQFGHGTRVYNVIDTRQSYLQDVVVAGLRALGYAEQADRSVHFNYEMVALSPRCCADLGIPLSEEDRKRPYVEVSGRKGLGVKADDLIDSLISKALEEVKSRHPDDPEESNRRVATQIAIAALRYFLLKFTRNTVIAFDFKEALSFEGETGPYCQYAAVRAGSIFRKLDNETLHKADSLLEEASADSALQTRISEVFAGDIGTEIWSLLMLTQQLEEVIALSSKSAEPANLAKYTFSVARAFSRFYQREENRIVDEKDDVRRAVLIGVTKIVRSQLTAALAILGIRVPEQM